MQDMLNFQIYQNHPSLLAGFDRKWTKFQKSCNSALNCYLFAFAFICFIHSFIHSGHFYSTSSSPLLPRGAPDFSTDSIGVSRRSAKATVSKGLAQGPNVAARAGVEPTTLRLRFIDLTNAPPMRHHVPFETGRNCFVL